MATKKKQTEMDSLLINLIEQSESSKDIRHLSEMRSKKLQSIIEFIIRNKATSNKYNIKITFINEINHRYPKLKDTGFLSRVAVNAEYVDVSHRLKAGDEIALIPPVSGGAISRGDV